MNTQLPLPERTLPPESAGRIRTVIMTDKPEVNPRRVRTWMLPLAAVLVVLALMATAAVLWPRTSQTEIAATPSASPSAGSAEPTPESTEPPSPTPLPPRTEPLEPGPKVEPLDTDRGPLTTKKARALITECNAPTEGVEPEKFEVEEIYYARRVTDGEQVLDMVIFRKGDAVDWACAPASGYVAVDSVNPDNGPNPSFPVVSDSGQTNGTDSDGATSQWTFRALPSVERIQVRAVVKGKPQRWFEGKVDGGFAFVPVFIAGKFKLDRETFGITGVTFEQRAFDSDGHEVPVRVMALPR